MTTQAPTITHNPTQRFLILVSAILIALGIAGKFYGINEPWKTKDHYNYGGVFTTAFAECLQVTPLSVSKGIPHTGCQSDQQQYYRNHPPTLLFAMWGWTSVFGHAEWSYRLFILTFSVLNIFLVFAIAKRVGTTPAFPWLAAAFQSTFLAGIYFGTHLDFIGEFTVFFVLVTAWLALSGRMTAACFGALAAGVSSWPGYITFAPLWAYAWLIGKGRKRVFVFGAFAFLVALATLMWLQQTWDIVTFLHGKILNQGYVDKKQKGWLEPLHFVKNFITSQARLLSPVFAAFAFFEMIRGDGRQLVTGWRERWKTLTPFHHALLLSGGTGFVYALVGHEYVMIHIFLYLFLCPAFALLCARFIENRLVKATASRRDLNWLSGVALLFAALYPYGIFKGNAIHDGLTSALLILTALALIVWSQRKKAFTPHALAAFMFLGFTGNMSQVMNYRNEPDTERSFCEKARAEYLATGQPVHTNERKTLAKEVLYCRDVPIIYLDGQ